ncbi:12945_t:CDS:2, partial [Funneliformis geosporum]
GCGREKKKKINKPADDLIQEIQEQAVVADEKDAASTAPKTVVRERGRASHARGGGRGHGKRKTVTEATSFVPNTFQNDFDETTDNLDHERNRVSITLPSLKNDHITSREKEKQSVRSPANSKRLTSPKNDDCSDFSNDVNDNFDINDVEGDFSDDLNGNFNDFGRNVSVVSTKLIKKSNPLNKRTKKTGVTNLLLSDSEEETGKPEAFKDMTNALEICQWLVKRPKILTMAYQMYNMSDILLESPLLNETSNIINSKIMPDKEKSNAQLWGEEIRCLFLRCRELLDEAIEDFVKEIFNYDLFSDNTEEVISHSKRTLADFRSKFNKKIERKVQELKDKRLKEGLEIATITRLKVNEFISQEVVEQDI